MRFPLTFLRLATLAACLLGACEPRRSREATPDLFPILTPPAPAIPRINGPRVFAVRPGSPFLFQIPATGERPMEFSVTNLPIGLAVDRKTGLITGALRAEGKYSARLIAENALGRAEKEFSIEVGDAIALTPPMGWNSWNCWGGDVTQEKMSAAARALVATGLRDHGWTYVNIDDGWQGLRGGPFEAIQPNRKFPSMRGLSDEIHALGLKFGIYSTPWRTSYYGHIGSSCDNADGSYDWITAGKYTDVFRYRYPANAPKTALSAWLHSFVRGDRAETIKQINHRLRQPGKFSFGAQDAKQWSNWNVDYLKYDSSPIEVEPTAGMRQVLRKSGRDIVFSVTNRIARRDIPAIMELTNSWRTSNDIIDTWASISRIGFSQDGSARFAKPDHFHDADMLVLGRVGWGEPTRPTRLTSDEQYTHLSLWCLLSSPLLLGCDLEKLDAFTLGLLTNDEVLAIDQDPLCRQAICVAHAGDRCVYAKQLEDGAWAVGLFNRGEKPSSLTMRATDLGLKRLGKIRDSWRQKDLGTFGDQFATIVAPHGVVLIRVEPSQR